MATFLPSLARARAIAWPIPRELSVTRENFVSEGMATSLSEMILLFSFHDRSGRSGQTTVIWITGTDSPVKNCR
jgi:hypothetical protein